MSSCRATNAKARHLSLRAMWETCPDDCWLSWIVGMSAIGQGELSRLDQRAVDAANLAHAGNGSRVEKLSRALRAYHSRLPWSAVEPRVRAWLGLPAKEETR